MTQTLYRACRWYDAYPNLVFILQVVRLMPLTQQDWVGTQLSRHLNASSAELYTPASSWQNRWMDTSPQLLDALEQLKQMPHSTRLSATDFLLRLLQIESQQESICA